MAAAAQRSFVWYELMTSDVAAAKAFYGAGDTQVSGLMALPKEACDAGMKPFWVGYFALLGTRR